MKVSQGGKYTLGETEGSFEALSADRVRMRTLQHGVMVGMLDRGLVLAESQFTLVLPDASTMVFERMP